jgi:hypothetical protein
MILAIVFTVGLPSGTIDEQSVCQNFGPPAMTGIEAIVI